MVKLKCACSNHISDFAEYGFTSVCGLKVDYLSCFAKKCPFRIRSGKPCDPNGIVKAHNLKKRAVKEKIAVEAFTTAVTVREDSKPDREGNTHPRQVGENTTLGEGWKNNSPFFCTATGSTSYVGKDAVQAELELSSLYTVLITDRRKNGSKGSIVMTDYKEHGFNFSRLTALDARALYSAKKDSEGLRVSLNPSRSAGRWMLVMPQQLNARLSNSSSVRL